MKWMTFWPLALLVSCGPRVEVAVTENPSTTTRLHAGSIVGRPVMDEIARCGGGIRLTEHRALKVKIERALSSGELSATRESDLRAAFLSAYSDNRPAVNTMFDRYVDCVSGGENLKREQEEILQRAPEVEDLLEKWKVPPEVIEQVNALASKEVDALQAFKFAEAREAALERSQLVSWHLTRRGMALDMLRRTRWSSNQSPVASLKEAEDDAIEACRLLAGDEACAEFVSKRAEEAILGVCEEENLSEVACLLFSDRKTNLPPSGLPQTAVIQ